MNDQINILEKSIAYNLIPQQTDNKIVGVYINGKISSLMSTVTPQDRCSFVYLNTTDGQRIYKRSVLFLLYAAFYTLYPQYTLECSHSIYKGEYVEALPCAPSAMELKRVLDLMDHWIKNNEPIQRVTANEENIKQTALIQNADITKANGHFYIYQIADYLDFSIDVLVPFAGILTLFDIVPEDRGFLISIPSKKDPSRLSSTIHHAKLAQTFQRMEDWSKIHGIQYLGDLNNMIMQNDYKDMIYICEALQENLFADTARKAIEQNTNAVLLTGPSSSGKTTSAYRLRIQFLVQGKFPMVISMDDYFKDRAEMQIGEDGKPDFESLWCVDLEDFAKQMYALIEGKEVKLRRFEFVGGHPYYDEHSTKMPENGILIIEGIHAFNPEVVKLLSHMNVYKVAVNPLTLINIDHHNRLSSSDVRKIRRIARDIKTRGFSAEKVLDMWPSIRRGEEKNIFPYLEDCDIMINTTLVYEVAALKRQAIKALEQVPKDSDCYPEANRLLEMLAKVKTLPSDKYIPLNSILREFVGE